jgi:dTDP-4-dehydrorhamnose 3,5-epimerase
MDKNDVIKELQDKVSVQDYSKKTVIDGVKFIDLNLFTDDGGSFMELMRLDSGQVKGVEGFELKQVNHSVLEAGAVKAFHLHFEQEELWYIPPANKALMGLYDVRAESPTKGVSMRFALGDHKTRLLLIPRGVAHGVANVTQERQQIIYFSSNTFNIEQPDENRLPWDVLGADFWSIANE